MKKVFVWALMATLLVAGSAFAGKLQQAPNATFPSGAPTSTNNDDTCDISTAPAATLLLPYFEVDVNAPATTAQTTLFTVTNTSRQPQIAHVTVWTDYSYPVLDFNIFLTGYDVQAINLYDVFVRGLVAPDKGTSNANTPGSRSLSNTTGNPNFLPGATTACNATGQNSGRVPETLRQNVVSALTQGLFPLLCDGETIGGTHTNAIGYVTLDVAATCSTNLPTEPAYWTTEVLFDNVLIGDYQQINPNPTTGNLAQGNPMVHIRAIPEGGPAGAVVATNLPWTFYTRYQSIITPTRDRRQPLPHIFAARYIEGGTSGFVTGFKIWREGQTGASADCDEYADPTFGNAAMPVREIVRFDERENPFVSTATGGFSPVPPGGVSLPETSRVLTTNTSIFPALTSGDVGGWFYLNLHNNSVVLSPAGRPSQNWVIVSMAAEGRYSVDFDAAWLGNGCSGLVGAGAIIGPAPNTTP